MYRRRHAKSGYTHKVAKWKNIIITVLFEPYCYTEKTTKFYNVYFMRYWKLIFDQVHISK